MSPLLQQAEKELARQKAAWAAAKKTLQAQQSTLQDECNDLACQLTEREQQLRSRDERIARLKARLEEHNLPSSSRSASRRVTQV